MPPPHQVVFCKLSPLQLKLYNFFLNSKPVQALLASTAPPPPGAASGKGGGARSGKGGGGGGAAASGGGGKAPKPPKPKEDALAPLAAITALKKLCCHPDLVYNMAAAAEGLSRGFGGAFAPQRASARAAEKKSAAGGDASGGGGGGAVAGSGRGGGEQQLTGFEGCLPLFGEQDVYPTYKTGSCQAYHSGAGLGGIEQHHACHLLCC